ncbi:MAG: hypothetical protein HZR80_16920 [Candidatus Heimdallarchaeota archaeon]
MTKSKKKKDDLLLIDPSDENIERKLIVAAKLLEEIEPELSKEILTRRSAEAES